MATQETSEKTQEKISETEVYVGVQVEINNQTVNLAPKTPINQIDAQGLQLELAKPLQIGKLGEVIYKIATEDFKMDEESVAYFKTDGKRKETGFGPLDNVIDAALGATLTVQALYYQKYPESAEAQYFKDNPEEDKLKAGKSDYLFAASARCDKPPEQQGDFFKFNGLFVVIAKGVKKERVAKVLEESIKGVQPALQSGDKPPVKTGEESGKGSDVSIVNQEKPTS